MYSNQLKKLRNNNNITQAFLSLLLGVHEYVYGQYEREYVIMPLKHLNILSNYYHVSIDYIFEFVNDNNYFINNQEIDKNLMGNRLKEFRKENKITQNKLASFLNTTHSVISDYERGRYLIATPFLYQICKKYHISADYLLGKVDEPKYFK